MIRLQMIDLGIDSPSCPPQCQKYQPNGCQNCSSRIRTVYCCPKCETVGSFFGIKDPKECKTCKHKFPDLYLLKSEAYTSEKMNYHLGITA